MADPIAVVQTFIDAFNARDVDRLVGCFSADAVLQDDAGDMHIQGHDKLREHFNRFLPHSPNVHAEVRTRMHVGAWVVQAEHTTGLVLDQPIPDFDIISAYHVEDGSIVKCMGLQ